MAENNITGKAAVINWIWSGGTVALNPDYRSVSTSESVDLAETTAGNDAYKTYIATLKSASIDFSGLFQSGTAGTVVIGALAAGNAGTIEIYPEGTASTNLKRSYPAISAGPKINMPYSDVVEVSCSFTANGAWS